MSPDTVTFPSLTLRMRCPAEDTHGLEPQPSGGFLPQTSPGEGGKPGLRCRPHPGDHTGRGLPQAAFLEGSPGPTLALSGTGEGVPSQGAGKNRKRDKAGRGGRRCMAACDLAGQVVKRGISPVFSNWSKFTPQGRAPLGF